MNQFRYAMPTTLALFILFSSAVAQPKRLTLACIRDL